MKKVRLAFVFALGLLAVSPAWAQSAPRREVTSSPARDADAKAAFLALSEPDRRALQEALGWLGFYIGVDDGGYGKRTIDALTAYQQSVGATADGVLTSKQFSALKEAAEKAEAAVGFKMLDDPTGVRIGAPTKLLEKREGGAGFTSLASKDGQVRLDIKETSGKLAALFKFLTADAPNHKFTYKVIKPDAWFVIAGEEGDKKFYRRYVAAPAEASDAGKLRGFMFVYPKAQAKTLDPVALAIANAFDPFPAPAPVASPTPVASLTPTPTPAASATPAPPKLSATALIVAPGVAVTTLAPAQCDAPTIEGKAARFLDSVEGLARLGGDFGAGAAAPLVGPAGDDLVALSLAPGEGPEATLQVASASAVSASGGLKIVAALGPAATGAPVFNRQGELVAFVAPLDPAKTRAGVALAEPHATLPARSVGEESRAAGGPLTAPEIAARMRAAVVGVYCGA